MQDSMIQALNNMADAYENHRSDVADILRDILDGNGFDPKKIEHRFAFMRHKDGIVVYDTLTTLFSILDPITLEVVVEGSALRTWYSDKIEFEEMVLGQITVNDVDELTGDIISSILPSISEKASDALYDVIHNEIMSRWRDK